MVERLCFLLIFFQGDVNGGTVFSQPKKQEKLVAQQCDEKSKAENIKQMSVSNPEAPHQNEQVPNSKTISDPFIVEISGGPTKNGYIDTIKVSHFLTGEYMIDITEYAAVVTKTCGGYRPISSQSWDTFSIGLGDLARCASSKICDHKCLMYKLNHTAGIEYE